MRRAGSRGAPKVRLEAEGLDGRQEAADLVQRRAGHRNVLRHVAAPSRHKAWGSYAPMGAPGDADDDADDADEAKDAIGKEYLKTLDKPLGKKNWLKRGNSAG